MKIPPDSPLLLLLAGSNGAGKSTFYRHRLSPHTDLRFINADRVAKAVFGDDYQVPENSYEAARLAEEMREAAVANGESFIMETVFSDPVGAKVEFLERAQKQGFFVSAHFIGIDSPMLSMARVEQRVQAGGHDVPDEKLASRFPRTLANLERLLDMADELTIYDNSNYTSTPFRVIAHLKRGVLHEFAAGSVPNWARALKLESRVTAETKFLPSPK